MELSKYKACICEGAAESAIDVKSYDFVKEYFSDPDTLVRAIKEYRRTANIPNGEYTLLDLLK